MYPGKPMRNKYDEKNLVNVHRMSQWNMQSCLNPKVSALNMLNLWHCVLPVSPGTWKRQSNNNLQLGRARQWSAETVQRETDSVGHYRRAPRPPETDRGTDEDTPRREGSCWWKACREWKESSSTGAGETSNQWPCPRTADYYEGNQVFLQSSEQVVFQLSQTVSKFKTNVHNLTIVRYQTMKPPPLL